MNVIAAIGLIRTGAVGFYTVDVRRSLGNNPKWRCRYDSDTILVEIIDGFAWQQKVMGG